MELTQCPGRKEHHTVDEDQESVHRSVEQKADEIADISQSDARAHPRTVMIVHFNAHATFTTVERARRTHNLARVTVGERLSQRRVQSLIFSQHESIETEVLLYWRWELSIWSLALMVRSTVAHFVRPLIIECFRANLWDYTRFNSRSQIEHSQDVDQANYT